MSYDITFWDPSLTPESLTTWDDVVRSVSELDGQRPGVNEKFVLLAERLEATNVGLDQDLTGRDASLYGFGTIAAGIRTWESALLRIGLPRTHAVELLYVAVHEANALGL